MKNMRTRVFTKTKFKREMNVRKNVVKNDAINKHAKQCVAKDEISCGDIL